jgi:hypothetical protein
VNLTGTVLESINFEKVKIYLSTALEYANGDQQKVIDYFKKAYEDEIIFKATKEKCCELLAETIKDQELKENQSQLTMSNS